MTPEQLHSSTAGTELLMSDAVAAHVLEDRRRRDRGREASQRVISLVPDSEPFDDIEVLTDAGEGRSGIASLVRRANHDGLTGLANRSWFTRAVQRSLFERADGTCGALFLIDLDGFKAVNDTWGHGAGDAVIVEVASRLAAVSRHSGLAARFGGDEFAVWIPTCTESQAHMIAERLVSQIAEPVPGDLGLSVGSSIGWVLVDDSAPVGTLLSRADIAMYAIKERGGHGHRQFDRLLASQRVEGRVLQREIRHGLSVGQFALAHQAITTCSGAVAGIEVLARWCHPRRGILQPDHFLDAIKSAGNNRLFDRYILEHALELPNQLPAEQSVWVNFTGDSLNDDFVRHARTQLACNPHVDPARIVFEISERSSVDSDVASAAVNDLAELGFRIAIDDFGTGFSRLGAMANLPISFVKIDRQFLAKADTEPAARKMLGAIVDLIHAIGAEVVAEGIETQSQADIACSLGCEYLQGYFFGRPQLPAA